jgi:hypothetical protein
VLVDAIVGWLFDLVMMVIGLLPVINLDLSGLHELDSYTGWIGALVDVGALATMAAWIAACETSMWIVRSLLTVRQLKFF